MTTRIFAKVRPDILVWARESAGVAIHDAAKLMGQSEEVMSKWELGTAAPSIPQLRELAKIYKRPLSVFYLQEVPQNFMVVSDFRRTPTNNVRKFSPELTQEIRVAHQRRALVLELLEDIGEEPVEFNFSLRIEDPPEASGAKIREFFGYTNTALDYKSDSSGRLGLNSWRERLESSGVLIFQTTRINSSDASGFAIAYNTLPTVVINRKDAPVRRLFSLLHEFTHLALRKSGVSESDVEAPRPPEDAALEIYCNAVAAAALLPLDIFLKERVVINHGASASWSDEEIKTLANRYNVSKEVVIRRLLTCNKTTNDFYALKRQQYLDEYQAHKDKELGVTRKSEMKRNMPLEAISIFGLPFVGVVMQNYHQDRLTLSEVTGYLGLRTHHVEKLEHKLGGR